MSGPGGNNGVWVRTPFFSKVPIGRIGPPVVDWPSGTGRANIPGWGEVFAYEKTHREPERFPNRGGARWGRVFPPRSRV